MRPSTRSCRPPSRRRLRLDTLLCKAPFRLVAGTGHIKRLAVAVELTRRHFARRGVQAECIRLSGAVELAPQLGLSQRIVDLVASGATLRANRLAEVETIAEVTARLIVNRAALKMRHGAMQPLIERIREATHAG